MAKNYLKVFDMFESTISLSLNKQARDGKSKEGAQSGYVTKFGGFSFILLCIFCVTYLVYLLI